MGSIAGPGYYIVIFDAQLDAMFVRRGMVYTHERRRARRAETIAKQLVKNRTNVLRWSIHVKEQTARKKRMTGFFLGSDVPYMRYVEEGTDTPIRARSKKGMSVPVFKGATERTRRRTVRGQKAQHILVRAMNQVTPG